MPMLAWRDRKSTRLNSSHTLISYAVFCFKKDKTVCRHLDSRTSSLLPRGSFHVSDVVLPRSFTNYFTPLLCYFFFFINSAFPFFLRRGDPGIPPLSPTGARSI